MKCLECGDTTIKMYLVGGAVAPLCIKHHSHLGAIEISCPNTTCAYCICLAKCCHTKPGGFK